ncbi:hypothetical protein AB0B31_14735 [Catellatospora citrea]|uniref:hypothetical protein n=1 Tax=Catellatospora citrea TaxID=53366 RepID=UPI0033F489D8
MGMDEMFDAAVHRLDTTAQEARRTAETARRLLADEASAYHKVLQEVAEFGAERLLQARVPTLPIYSPGVRRNGLFTWYHGRYELVQPQLTRGWPLFHFLLEWHERRPDTEIHCWLSKDAQLVCVRGAATRQRIGGIYPARMGSSGEIPGSGWAVCTIAADADLDKSLLREPTVQTMLKVQKDGRGYEHFSSPEKLRVHLIEQIARIARSS